MGGKADDQGAQSAGRWLADSASAADPARRALRTALDEAAEAQQATPPTSDLRRQRIFARIDAPWRSTQAGRRGQAAADGALDLEGGARKRPGWRIVGFGVVTVAIAVAAGFFMGSRGLLLPNPTGPGANLAVGAGARTPAEPVDDGAEIDDDASAGPALPSLGTVALTTASGERSRHRLARGVVAQLFPRTALVPGDELVPPEVTVGRVQFRVPHQRPGRSYAVHAGGYEVVVLGTVFTVAVEDRGVSVSVETGIVEVRDLTTGQKLSRLVRGQGWSSGQGAVAPGRLSDPGQRHGKLRTSSHSSPRATTIRSLAARPRSLALASSKPIGADADPAAGKDAGLTEARRARLDGDPRRALALYETLASAGGPLAEAALYEMGAITVEDLHDPDGAIAIWDRLRQRYPQGLVRAEVDLEVLEVLAEQGDEARALEEARGFLRRHPDSERRGEVARVAADLERTRGDCAAALSLYEEATRSRLPADREDAAFYRAVCLASLGDPSAHAALGGYLERFPEGRHVSEAGRLLRAGH